MMNDNRLFEVMSINLEFMKLFCKLVTQDVKADSRLTKILDNTLMLLYDLTKKEGRERIRFWDNINIQLTRNYLILQSYIKD